MELKEEECYTYIWFKGFNFIMNYMSFEVPIDKYSQNKKK